MLSSVAKLSKVAQVLKYRPQEGKSPWDQNKDTLVHYDYIVLGGTGFLSSFLFPSVPSFFRGVRFPSILTSGSRNVVLFNTLPFLRLSRILHLMPLSCMRATFLTRRHLEFKIYFVK